MGSVKLSSPAAPTIPGLITHPLDSETDHQDEQRTFQIIDDSKILHRYIDGRELLPYINQNQSTRQKISDFQSSKIE